MRFASVAEVKNQLSRHLARAHRTNEPIVRVFAIKSRVHFRRGFDDSGFAKTILLVEPEQPFLGTVRLEALPYRNVDISTFYPYGDVSFP
jgi:microcystin degradation protein MlrC